MKIKILVSCPKLLSQSFAAAGGHDAYRTPSRDQISISGNTAAIHNPSGGNIQALYMEGYWHLNPGAKPNNETEAATTTSTEAATTTSTAASEGNCTERGIDPEQLRQGECVENGIHKYVVDRSTELRLPEESIRYEGYRTAKTIHAELGTTTAQGVFVIVKLAVRNNTTEPKRFDADQGATGLLLGKDEYSEDENAENEPEVDSFDWESEPIQPGNTLEGTVIYDMPPTMVKQMETDGYLCILQFANEGDWHDPPAMGIIRTFH